MAIALVAFRHEFQQFIGPGGFHYFGRMYYYQRQQIGILTTHDGRIQSWDVNGLPLLLETPEDTPENREAILNRMFQL